MSDESKFIELAATMREKTMKAVRQRHRESINSIMESIEMQSNLGQLWLGVDVKHAQNKEMLAFFQELGYTVEIKRDDKTCIPTMVIIGW